MIYDQWLNFQRSFLDSLQSRIGNIKLVDVLSNVLEISQNAAYKKINLATKLNLDEIIELSIRYQLSIDQFLSAKSSPIPFYSDAIRKMPEQPKDYFLNLIKHLYQLKELKGLNYINLTGEVPIFHIMPFRKLMFFKLFAWNYTSWSIKRYMDKFDLNSFINDKELNNNIDKCIHVYYKFQGIEIWNIRMMDITLDQLKYFIQLRIFPNKNVVQEIINEMFDLLDHLTKISESGTKLYETSTELNKSLVKVYISELVHANEVIYVNSDISDHIFCALDSPNFLRSSDPRVTEHVHQWLLKTLKHSSLISGEGEKDRRTLIQTIQQKLVKGNQEINNLLNFVYGM